MTGIVYRNGMFFDGTGRLPVVADVAVKEGRISAIGPHLDVGPDTQEIECQGQWVMPGMLDIHTHLDLEVELAPELPEVVRHGTTTVIMSNCSIGVTYGHQRRDGEDPIVDCFARVENMPKTVLKRVADTCTWSNSRDYLQHLESLPLGPNVVPMIPHSMLRIEVMGLYGSVSRSPTRKELARMESLLEMGMEEGYAGFSTDALPFHFLANAPNKRKRIPTQYAGFRELKRLTDIVRRYDRLWQATPPKDDFVAAIRSFLLTSGRLYGRPLRTTVLAALDLQTNRTARHLCMLLSRILNSCALQGKFRFQALTGIFRIWSDGAINPLADEIPEFRELNEMEFEDREGRARILNDPAWVKSFRHMWLKGKAGFSLARLMRALRLEDVVLTRDLADMRVAGCPLPEWVGETLQQPYRRLVMFQASSGREGAISPAEKDFFATFPDPIGDDAAFLIHLFRQWDTDLRWETIIANRDGKVLRDLLFHEQTLPGFNDSGAHLANIGFYDGNLRVLKIAQSEGLERVAQAIHRLTALPAEFLGLNTGRLKVGAQADICVVDPVALEKWDPEATYRFVEREQFGCKQVINRPDNVVRNVMIGGRVAWDGAEYADEFGRTAYGRVMKGHNHPSEQTFA
ncbi:N-acyl-D-glutamate deacylase [Acetobacter estunensis NRIC 0472]|uniref:Amidohydrolase family protein n=1 Tax=Acetobacter estunensis TaxID=104097 RepID=A0A967BC68_9PROT|nr:amidohydrolase family protein [Acetobacter estunensis]NHO54348.1 amidohydrolase family protein [Acetobacter estunensis]GBQ21882.1 N-acyl-D-glutamate deacylase [Acetobacter estunensis NRIC 0472]